jgi:AcrR family transcriptional regulator
VWRYGGVVPPKKGQRQVRGLARRQQILDTCLELFATNGYRATSLSAIATAVGLTEAGVLHHFPTKDELVLAVLAHRDAVNPNAEAHVAAPGGGLGSLRRIPSLARILLDQPTLMRFDAVVQGEAIADGGAALAHVRARLHAIRGALVAMLEEGVRRGEVRADVNTGEVATEIVAFMDGVQTQWLLEAAAVDLETAYERYFEALAARLSPPRRSRRQPASSRASEASSSAVRSGAE